MAQSRSAHSLITESSRVAARVASQQATESRARAFRLDRARMHAGVCQHISSDAGDRAREPQRATLSDSARRMLASGSMTPTATFRPVRLRAIARAVLLAAACASIPLEPVTAVAGAIVETFAGGGAEDGRPAISVPLAPLGIAVDAHGNLLVADWRTNRVRRVDAGTGFIEPVAGSGGYSGSCGEGGPATAACLEAVSDVVVDRSGDLVIADGGFSRILRVDHETGVIVRVAGRGRWGDCATLADFADGQLATVTCFGDELSDLTVDGKGNIFVTDTKANRVRRIDAITQLVSTVAGNGEESWEPACADGVLATETCVPLPIGVAVDGAGNVFVTSRFVNHVRRVDAATGIISTIAGGGGFGACDDGGPAVDACLSSPGDLLIDHADGLLIADRSGPVRRVDLQTATMTTVAGGSCTDAATQLCVDADKIALDPAGNLFVATRYGHRVRRFDVQTGAVATVAGYDGTAPFCGDGGPATDACLGNPPRAGKDHDDALGVTVDAAENVFVADGANERIRRVDGRTGVIETVVGSCIDDSETCLQEPTAVAVAPDGDLAIVDTDSFRAPPSRVLLRSAQTGRASSLVQGPLATDLAFDRDGTLLVDWPYAGLGRSLIQRIDPVSTVRTIVAAGPSGAFCGDGGPAATTGCFFGFGLGRDDQGNVLIADQLNNRVRHVDAQTGVISTIAGNGTAGDCGDGGPATDACLEFVNDVASDRDGNVFISAGRAIRRVDHLTGDISTVVGPSEPALCDRAESTAACVQWAGQIAVGPSGALYVADLPASVIHRVKPCVAMTRGVLSVDQIRHDGSRRFALRGHITLSQASPSSIDPTVDGLRIEVRSGGDTVIDMSIPGGAVSRAGDRGWRSTRHAWSYHDRLGTPDGTHVTIEKGSRNHLEMMIRGTESGSASVLKKGAATATVFFPRSPVGEASCADAVFAQSDCDAPRDRLRLRCRRTHR